MRNFAIITFVFALFLISCKENSSIEPQEAQVNMEVTIEDEPMLLGEVNRSGLVQEKYKSWFDYNYDNYHPDSKVLEEVSKNISDVDIKIFMGTWCSDSEREIPAFYKMLDSLTYQPKSFEIISTDRTKKLPEQKMNDFEIVYIPTFIFYRNDIELGKIIESPTETLDKDILNIITNQPL
jgi:thiol-disulfide isomerase/thioredoxin